MWDMEMWVRIRNLIDILTLSFLYSFFFYWTPFVYSYFLTGKNDATGSFGIFGTYLIINAMFFIPLCILNYFLLFFKNVAPEIIYFVLALIPLLVLFFGTSELTLAFFLALLGYGLFVSSVATTIFLIIDRKCRPISGA